MSTSINKDFEFKVGDIVDWGGAQGIIEYVGDDGIRATFDTHSAYFIKDGRFADWHKEPSLKFISRKREPRMYWAARKQVSGKIVTIVEFTSLETNQEPPSMLPPCSNQDLPVWIKLVEVIE